MITTLSPAALLLTALLSLLRPPANVLRSLERRHDDIVARAESAERQYGVPAGLLLAVGYSESQLGADPASGGSWGAPRDRMHRHLAGGVDHAARALAWSYRVCHRDWLAAVRRFRTGLCAVEPRHGYTGAFVIRFAERIYARAGIAEPVQLRSATTLARQP